MKASTERDLLRLKSDLGASTRAMQGACGNLNQHLKSSESNKDVSRRFVVEFFDKILKAEKSKILSQVTKYTVIFVCWWKCGYV